MKIIFMGTPEFALPCLENLYNKYGIEAVFTKIDKPNARGKKIIYNPIKEFALKKNIKIYQPLNFKDDEILKTLKEIKPDLIVVVAYGKILPKEVLDIPKYGVINVHSSLLPKYRGAAPINAAIINGEKESGVSVMKVVEELDAGPVILSEKVAIDDMDNFLSLHDKLKNIGAKILIDACELIFDEKANFIPQDESKATFVKPFKKEDGKIDWNNDRKKIFNMVRGMNPVPCAYTFLNEKLFKIYEVEEYDKNYFGVNGEIVDFIKGKGVVVKVEDGAVILKSVKPENKKVLSGVDIINGKYFSKGDVLC